VTHAEPVNRLARRGIDVEIPTPPGIRRGVRGPSPAFQGTFDWPGACIFDVMLDPVVNSLEKYLDLLSVRQKLIASNIANVDTPGYKTRDVDFQSEFQSMLEGGRPEAKEVPGLLSNNDGNNVNIDREARLLNATLNRLVGRDHYRADVSVDCDMSSGEQSDEVLDPGKSVMLTSQKTEEVSAGSGSSGVPGTPSNLPRPVSRPGGSGVSTTKRTENATYESSRMIRKVKLPRGTIRRLSVAVLLDQTLTWKGVGSSAQKILTPPSPQTIESVRQVVSASVGFSQERGDQITVETLPFEATLNQPPPPAPPATHPAPQSPAKWLDLTKQPLFLPIAVGAGVLVLLAVGAVVFLLVRRKKKRKATAEIRKDLPAGAKGSPELPAADAAQEIAAQMENRLLEQAAEQEQADMATLASIKIPPAANRKAEVIVKQLRENAKKDATASALVLQTWLHERG
jgi:flagellar biosynthesis/type III secretory pathway M-ring protein FliF/YscJ